MMERHADLGCMLDVGCRMSDVGCDGCDGCDGGRDNGTARLIGYRWK